MEKIRRRGEGRSVDVVPDALSAPLRRFALALALIAGATAILGAAPATAAGANVLSVKSVRVGTKLAPVVIRVTVPRQASVSARVNGRPARVLFRRESPRVRSAQLSLSNGLRPGRNRIRLAASLPTGRSAKQVAIVRLPRGVGIADAGRDVDAVVGETVVLGSKAAPNGAKARASRWRVVKAPAGSQARLTDPRAATPEFVPDVAGTYIIGLRVADGGATRHDRALVTTRPDDPPIGVPIETLSSAPDAAIRINGAPVKDTYDRNGIFVAVLERTSRGVVESGTVPRNGGGIDQLASIAAHWGGTAQNDRYLMIVSGPRGVNGADLGKLNDLVTSLGVEKLNNAERSSLGAGHPFSFVGIPGGVDGAGWKKIPTLSSVNDNDEFSDPAAGDIRGFLQLNQAVETPFAQKNYDLVIPDNIKFDTRVGGAKPTSNTMSINGQTVTASLPAGTTAGFHFVLVSSATGHVLANRAMQTNPYGQQDAATQLLLWANDSSLDHPIEGRPLLFVQSIGHPNGDTFLWNDLAQQFRDWGSSFFIPMGLDGKDDYALVGQLHAIAPTAESTTAAGEDGELSGILTRDRGFRFAPTLAADGMSPVTAEMFDIAYQAPQPFPAFTGGKQAAETYIGIALGFCDTGSATCDMRRRYYENYDASWLTKYDFLRDRIHHPGGSPGFSPEDFESVKNQLLTEILDLMNIKNYFDALQKPFDRVQGRGLLDLQKLGDQLRQDIGATDGRSSAWGLQLVAAVLAIASEGASEKVAPALSGTAGALGLASLFADDDGSAALADEITANVNDLSGKLADRYDFAQRTVTGIALMMVSDWGKMQAVSGKVDRAPWKLPSPATDAIPPLRLATNQWFAQALVPATYPSLIYVNPSGTPNGLTCHFPVGDVSVARHPWHDLAANMQVQVTTNHTRLGDPVKTSVFATRDFDHIPSGTIGNLLFNAPDGRAPGLGLDPLRFFDPALFGGKLLHADNDTEYCHLRDQGGTAGP